MTTPLLDYDVFVCHASEDKASARTLALELRHAGFKVWFDEWELAVGDDVRLRIEDGLARSQAALLLLSAAFLASEWTRLELHTKAFRDPFNLRRSLLPVKLEDCDLPDSLRRLANYELTELTPPYIDALIKVLSTRLGLTGRKRVVFDSKLLADSVPAVARRESSGLAEAYFEVMSAAHKAKKAALLFIDIDGFTYINARHSVAVGEKVLTRIHELLAASLPAGATISRWRADEFVAVLPEVDERDGLRIGAEMVAKAAALPWHEVSSDLFVSISCGVAGRNRKNTLSDVEWIEKAILGCKAAKLRGGGRARQGERLFTTEGERLRKTMAPLAWLHRYGSDD